MSSNIFQNNFSTYTVSETLPIITIMVLELKIPHNPTLATYLSMWPVFVSYAISFLFVGLNWANHHHLFHTVTKISNHFLWVNMLNLFVLSLVPFATAAMGENHFKAITVTIYASVLTISIVFYLLLVNALCELHGKESAFTNQFKGRKKAYASLGLNVLSILISIIGYPQVAFWLLVITSIAWFIPNHIFEDNHK